MKSKMFMVGLLKWGGRLLTDKTDENGNITEKSLKTQIDEIHIRLQDEIQAVTDERKAKEAEFAILKASLEAEIRSLLPNAAAASLAHGYVEAKGRYGFVPYDDRLKADKYGWAKFIHFLKGNSTSFIHHVFLLVPLVAMAWLFYDLFKNIHDPDLNQNVLLFRALIAAPLIAMVVFGWRSISLNRRLYEEYNHKQRVMQLYHGFKEQVEKTGNNEELQKALLAIMLSVVQDKPSLAMSSYDNGPGISIPGFGTFFALKGKNE